MAHEWYPWLGTKYTTKEKRQWAETGHAMASHKRYQGQQDFFDRIKAEDDEERERYVGLQAPSEPPVQGSGVGVGTNGQVIDLDIKKDLSAKGEEYYARPLMEEGIIPFHGAFTVLAGPTKSGKSNALANLVKDARFWGRDHTGKHYFHRIYIFSPCGKFDPLVQSMVKEGLVKKEDVVDMYEEKEAIDKLSAIYKEQAAIVEKVGQAKAPRLLIIHEDATSCWQYLQSKAFRKLVTTGRHVSCSNVACVHRWVSVHREARLQAHNVMIFKPSLTEIQRVCTEFGHPKLSKEEFSKVVHHCTDEKYSFIHINTQQPIETWFRKKLGDIILMPAQTEAYQPQQKEKEKETGQQNGLSSRREANQRVSMSV